MCWFNIKRLRKYQGWFIKNNPRSKVEFEISIKVNKNSTVEENLPLIKEYMDKTYNVDVKLEMIDKKTFKIIDLKGRE